jgi:hypothetical protein
VRAVLSLRRGLALESLVLCHAGPQALLGTLASEARGAGSDDELFSGDARLEVPGEAPVTDLVPVEPEVEEGAFSVRVRALVPTALGPLPKEVRVHAHRIEIRYGFSAWGERPRGSLRAGALTLLDGALGDELWVSCANGGPRERLRLVDGFEAAGGSALFGATDGWIGIDDGRIGFEASWFQDLASALPRLVFRRAGSSRLLRLEFLLAEPDESFRPGARAADFHLSIRPHRNRLTARRAILARLPTYEQRAPGSGEGALSERLRTCLLVRAQVEIEPRPGFADRDRRRAGRRRSRGSSRSRRSAPTTARRPRRAAGARRCSCPARCGPSPAPSCRRRSGRSPARGASRRR